MILPISGNQNYYRGQSFKSSAPFYRKIDTNSGEYIKYIYKLVKSWCNQTCEVNVETGALQEIVHSNDACIFIMNHTKNQRKDANAAKFFNTLLYREYIYQNKSDTCPRSKVLASKNILDKAADGGKKLNWMGVVPVNVSLDKKKKMENAITIKNLVKEIGENKINLFLFPEGALAALTMLPLKYKFQPGVASIVKKVLELKDNIKVIPLGFAHNREETAIHIGKPVFFHKKNGTYYASRGNADSKFFDTKLAENFKNKDEIALTDKGEPVNYNNVVPYISGILMKNMECCSKEAKKDLHKGSKTVYII